MENILILKLLFLYSETEYTQIWCFEPLNEKVFNTNSFYNILPTGGLCYLYRDILCNSFNYINLQKEENDKFHEDDILFICNCSALSEDFTYLEAYIEGMKLFDKMQNDKKNN